MFLTITEKSRGYVIEPKDRYAKTLLHEGMILGSVCCRHEIETRIRENEKILDLMNRNKVESDEHKPFTPLQMSIGLSAIVVIAIIVDLYKG